MKKKLQLLFSAFLLSSVSVVFAQTTVLDESFEDGSLADAEWIVKDVTGAMTWDTSGYGGTHYAYMSGYDSENTTAVENEDWLISPAMDLSSFSSVTFSFRTATKFDGPALETKVSTDYDGTSAPSSATWTDLTATLSSGDWQWAGSGDIDLSNYTESSVYIAFKYTSTNDNSAAWEVDNISVVGTAGSSVSKTNEAADVSVYPNPVENLAKIVNGENLVSVAVINSLGSEVNVEVSEDAIDCSALASGFYFVKVTMKDGSEKAIKILKK